MNWNVLLEQKDIGSREKSDKRKYRVLGGAIIIGLILSGVLAYFTIDFTALIEVFIRNISNPNMFEKLGPIMRKWYIISIALVSVATLAFVIYIARNRKKNKDNIFTWGQTILGAIDLLLISQIVLPMFTFIIAIVITQVFLVFFSSVLLKGVIGYGTYLFALLTTKICTSLGIALPHGEFIGQEKYSMFLTTITFLILTPYLLVALIRLIKKIIQKATRNDASGLMFELVETVFNVNVLRYFMYILLFFTSVFTYSMNMSQSDFVFSLVKESLLEFVLLDTVIYSIYSNFRDKKIRRKQESTVSAIKYYTPFQYDLEFVLSAINMHNLKNKEIKARIKFPEDKIRILQGKKKKTVNEIDELLIEISTEYCKIDDLERKIKKILERIINL